MIPGHAVSPFDPTARRAAIGAIYDALCTEAAAWYSPEADVALKRSRTLRDVPEDLAAARTDLRLALSRLDRFLKMQEKP